MHLQGLYQHLEAQAVASIDGVLVAGTMGLLQLLSDRVYQDLVVHSSSHWKDHGELLVGVGDTSYLRTLERLRFVNELPIDGAVVLSPYFLTFSQDELVDYFTALANASHVPLYLYDLPQRTRTHLELETVLTLSEHPNIAGIKCSGDIDQTKLLISAMKGHDFRVIVAKPALLESLIREGVSQHLDGVFCIAPQITRQIAVAADRGDWEVARKLNKNLEQFLATLTDYGVFPAMTALLNALGIEGRFAPRPFRMLSKETQKRLFAEQAVIDIFGENFPQSISQQTTVSLS